MQWAAFVPTSLASGLIAKDGQWQKKFHLNTDANAQETCDTFVSISEGIAGICSVDLRLGI